MDKLISLNERLGLCYSKISYITWHQLPEDQKEEFCKREKTDLVDYLNSDSLLHENIVKEQINNYKSKISIFIYRRNN